MTRLFKVAIVIVLLILLHLTKSNAQGGNTNKILKACSDSIHAEMITSESDDIVFCIYDTRMNKIKLDSISGDGFLIFHNAKHPFKIRKIDNYRVKCTIPDFNGYIKLMGCELNLIFNNKKKQFVFVNQ